MSYAQEQSSEPPAITIRAAQPGDEAAVARVAQRDSRSVPAGPLLVAEAGGTITAAISLAGGAVIADPFTRTEEIVAMLRLQAGAQIRTSPAPVMRLERSRRERLALRTAA